MLKPKKKKSRKGKGKGDEDNLTELQGTPSNPSDITQGDSANTTSVMMNETRDQMMVSPKKKKKGRKDKGKNRADQVEEVEMKAGLDGLEFDQGESDN